MQFCVEHPVEIGKKGVRSATAKSSRNSRAYSDSKSNHK